METSRKRRTIVNLLIIVVSLAQVLRAQDIMLHGNIGVVRAKTPHTTLQQSRNLKLWSDVGRELYFSTATNNYLFFREFDLRNLTNSYKLAIVGDSTASTNGGWASGLQNYVRTNISLLHLAYPWQSSTRFIKSERFTTLKAEKPNYLFIQFGLMDSRVCGGEIEECYTSLDQFEKNILYIISICRGMECVPVLVTPPSLNYFTNGKVGRWHSDRRNIILKIGGDQDLLVIDLNTKTMDLFNKLGESKSSSLNWPNDSIHFSQFGANIIAGLVAEEFPKELLNYAVEPFFSAE